MIVGPQIDRNGFQYIVERYFAFLSMWESLSLYIYIGFVGVLALVIVFSFTSMQAFSDVSYSSPSSMGD